MINNKGVKNKMKKLLMSLFLVLLVSLSVASAAKTDLSGDFNKDSTVDYRDYFLFYDHMYTNSKDYVTWDPRYDLVKNGKVDHKDSLEFARVFRLYNQGTLVGLLEELDLETVSASGGANRVSLSRNNAGLKKNILLEFDKLKYQPANSNLEEFGKEREKTVNILLNHLFYELEPENRELTLQVIQDIGTLEDVTLAQNINLLLYGENMNTRIKAAKNLGQLGDKRAIDSLDAVSNFHLEGENRVYNHPTRNLRDTSKNSSNKLKGLKN